MSEIFDCSKNYILEDDYVLLRPLQPEDHKNLLSFAMQEPEIWKFSLVGGEGSEGLRHYMNLALTARAEEKEYPFIVFDKRTNEYAGSTRFYDIKMEYKTLQLGYTWYGNKFQGTGLNKRCKYLLLSFVFEQIGIERLEFRADNDNKRSIAAMQSIGCKVDGILRNDMPKRDGGRRSSIILSILKDEWFGEVKENLGKKL